MRAQIGIQAKILRFIESAHQSWDLFQRIRQLWITASYWKITGYRYFFTH
ncbi:Uncharacterised protein [Vibrio cholerae]|nr:Uncharacterised protein [Vibrio cholerae]